MGWSENVITSVPSERKPGTISIVPALTVLWTSAVVIHPGRLVDVCGSRIPSHEQLFLPDEDGIAQAVGNSRKGIADCPGSRISIRLQIGGDES